MPQVKAPVANALKKGWVAVVIVIVILVAGFVVTRLRSIFGYHDNRPITSGAADEIKPFNPKHVVYQVYGNGATANINYMDIHAQLQRVDNVPLPWTLSVTTTLPSVVVVGCQSAKPSCATSLVKKMFSSWIFASSVKKNSIMPVSGSYCTSFTVCGVTPKFTKRIDASSGGSSGKSDVAGASRGFVKRLMSSWAFG